METVSHMRIAKNQQLVSDHEHEYLYLAAEQLAKMLSGLRTSLARDI